MACAKNFHAMPRICMVTRKHNKGHRANRLLLGILHSYASDY
jgi:hypothetical protein